jgi:hypothetical protein
MSKKKSNTKKPQELNLIVRTTEIDRSARSSDRGGGETHGMFGMVSIFNKAPIKTASFTENLDSVLDGLEQVFARIALKTVSGWEVDGLSVSLAVSAEGSIGVATAGIEGGIEVSFKRKP